MKLAIAAGGTGGHLFPGIALAKLLQKESSQGAFHRIVFIGSDRGLEAGILEKNGFERESLKVGRLKGEGWISKIKTILLLPWGLLQAIRLLKRIQPDMVLGIGGYSSGPLVMAAFLLGIPRAILEPNAIPGLTNRWLGRFVNRIFISFSHAEKYFPREKVRLTGTPVREEISRLGQKENKTVQSLTLLVLGGSQGAHSINETMMKILPQLEASGKAWRIIHQTGSSDFERVKAAYEKSKIPSEVFAFIQDMEEAFDLADLVLSRSGASTVAEILETKRPCILVPYPFAADDHQRWNAEDLVQAGVGIMIMNGELEEKLFDCLMDYENHREKLAIMKSNFLKLRQEPAAEVMLRECLSLVGPMKVNKT